MDSHDNKDKCTIAEMDKDGLSYDSKRCNVVILFLLI